MDRQGIHGSTRSAAGTLAGWLVMSLALAGGTRDGRAQGSGMDQRLSALRAQVERMKADEPWRRIAWRRCLLSAGRESRRTNRPIFVWALGGDPTGRC